MNIIKNDRSLKSVKTLLEEVKNNTLLDMITSAERKLNKSGYHLSSEAKKRLRWLYVLYHKQDNNVTKTAHKLGLSREWLSQIKSLFEKGDRDPRKLEPKSKAPHDTSHRKRISKEIENKILKVRADSQNIWGKIKMAVVLKRDYGIQVNPNTINKYLHRHKKIDPKISLKNSKAWKGKLARENPQPELRVRYRPPKKIEEKAQHFECWATLNPLRRQLEATIRSLGFEYGF
ncbi:hypothetical protein HY061_00730 [Candidatus Azambacteria bacterium]|nr:hypothetical protein [Candidatus Azambacteria bacterium]